MPSIRPFRALRYADESRLAGLVSPPYDVISPEHARALAARDPHNVVRLELPTVEAGDEPDDRYRRAAHTLATWRSDGTLRKDPRPGVYVYEQAYVVPGTSQPRTQRGFFARLRLESFGSEVRAHERTLAGPREDRYKLLRATGTNLSPVVALHEDPSGRTGELLETVTRRPPTADLLDEAVRHRLWVVPSTPDDPVAAELVELAGSGPLTIADGHHRYETALRYRDERRMTRSCEEDPAFDYMLVLLLEAARQDLTVLPTHRLVLGLGDEGVRALWSRSPELFEVTEAPPTTVVDDMRGAPPRGGGRFGLLSRGRSALLVAQRPAFDPHLPPGGPAVRRLDVTLLGVALERIAGVDPAAVAAGGRIAYTKSSDEAAAAVANGDADVAFLLDPTPVPSILAVAAEGDVMPQKSTYFYPKALTGLVINPLEW